ncbi:MAG: DUF262 domain-containing HNH endonuclease family protein [Chloroflexi bacterium]|nr:DUF262 domain-containing HNH endonuclease family protein [Chloroflexota bacterium]
MINASKDKLRSFFQGDMQYIVPFFQRPYVWDEDNWEGFWENVNQIYLDYQKGKNSEHFIGTLIVKQKTAEELGQNQYDLIDGQQRLTTVSILLKCLHDSCKGNLPKLKEQIDRLLIFENAKGERFIRVKNCRIDLPYFKAVIQGDKTDHLNQDHKILKAYTYFKKKVQIFSDEEIDTLQKIVLEKVPVISMLLASDDDEQVIFDTINSMGVKLTTAELLKNHIFKDEKMEYLYSKLWEPVFEANEESVIFWDKDKTAGRMSRKNIEVLLYCYLIITTQNEIQLESLYKEYKQWLKGKTNDEKENFLIDLKQYAEYYANFPEGEELNEITYSNEEKRFFHIIENLSVTTAYPLVLFLYREISDIDERNRILKLLESYLVRRNVCRLTTKNYNNLFISLIKKLIKEKSEGAQISSASIGNILRSFTEETNRFPNDDDVRLAFKESFLSNQNAREILYLIALYQRRSTLVDVGKLSLLSYSVEHMMPVKWQENWEIADIDDNKKAIRNKTLKTLGNLTLVTKRLNSKLSNDAWEQKRITLKKYSNLNITTDYLDKDKWDETYINSRAADISDLAVEMWSSII